MTFLIKIVSIFWLTSLFASPVTADENPSTPITDQDYQRAIVESLGRMHDVINRRAYRVQDVNHSLQKTIDAVGALAEQNDLEKAETLLNDAIRLLPNNSLARLVLADVYEKQGEISKATEQYKIFLEKTMVMSSLTQDMMNWKTKLILRKYAQAKLLQQGIHVATPSTLPLMARLENEQDSKLLQVISYGLPITLVFGAFFLILGYVITDGDITRTRPYRMGARFFFVLIVVYLCWLAHIFLQWPALMNKEEIEVVAILLLGTVGIVLLEIKSMIDKKNEALSDPSLFPCTKCKRLIERLSSFCPYCKEIV